MLNFSHVMEQLMALHPTHNQRKTERNNKIKMQNLDMKLTKLTQQQTNVRVVHKGAYNNECE